MLSYIFNQLLSSVNLGKVVLVITLGRITSFTASSSRSTLSAVLLNLISDKLQYLFYLEPYFTNLWSLCLMQTQSHLPWPWPNSCPSLCSVIQYKEQINKIHVIRCDSVLEWDKGVYLRV